MLTPVENCFSLRIFYSSRDKFVKHFILGTIFEEAKDKEK